MNSKIIAAGVVVALCAVALIGVGYAYTATVDSPNNSISSNYITVQVGSGSETLFSTGDIVKYDTVTNESSVTYKSVADTWNADENIKVAKSSTLTLENVKVKIEIEKSQLIDDNGTSIDDTDDRNLLTLFYQNNDGEKKATASLTEDVQAPEEGQSAQVITGVFDQNGETIYWLFSDVVIGKEYTLSISYLGDASFNGTLEKGPKSLSIPIKITASDSFE